MNDFSEAELKLIKAISSSWHRMVVAGFVDTPSKLYEILAWNVFINDSKGPHIESLRKVCRAINNHKPYRRTPEFDALCEFEPHETQT